MCSRQREGWRKSEGGSLLFFPHQPAHFDYDDEDHDYDCDDDDEVLMLAVCWQPLGL